jgi:hypothetical protein
MTRVTRSKIKSKIEENQGQGDRPAAIPESQDQTNYCQPRQRDQNGTKAAIMRSPILNCQKTKLGAKIKYPPIADDDSVC